MLADPLPEDILSVCEHQRFDEHYFFLGDNRDCSSDSRFLSNVGYVHKNNLVGKANIIFFSNDTKKGSVLKFWNWSNSLRFNRFFKSLK